METKETICKRQSPFIDKLISDAKGFIDSLDKTEIQTILLSGSVSRGDFYPGKFGGMTDLTVMRKPGSGLTAEALFGPNEEPDIPFHCVTARGAQYQILFVDFVDHEAFQAFDEARKYAFLESRILWDKDGKYGGELGLIERQSSQEQRRLFESCQGYIRYLLSDYKKDRWYRRGAYCQMHENLNTAIRLAIQCLYYINGKFAPAEDRRLYYSFSLDKVPVDYEIAINALYGQSLSSAEDYLRRERAFNEILLDFVSTNSPPANPS